MDLGPPANVPNKEAPEEDPIRAATRLAEIARASADVSEQNGRVDVAFLSALREEGLGAPAIPLVAGGRGVDPAMLLRIIEIVAAGDGSAGWVTMIYATSSAAGHYLDSDGLDEVFGEGPASLTSGVLAPRGTARRVAGGYEVSGSWPFASGCVDAGWIGLGATTEDSLV